MAQVKPTYAAGRAIAGWVEFIGYVTVMVGLVFAAVAVAQKDVLVLSRASGVVAGLVVSASGLFFILQAQVARAALDTAALTQELVRMGRGESVPAVASSGGGRVETPEGRGAPDEFGFVDGEQIYKGVLVRRLERGRFEVGDEIFSTWGAAKRHISRNLT